MPRSLLKVEPPGSHGRRNRSAPADVRATTRHDITCTPLAGPPHPLRQQPTRCVTAKFKPVKPPRFTRRGALAPMGRSKRLVRHTYSILSDTKRTLSRGPFALAPVIANISSLAGPPGSPAVVLNARRLKQRRQQCGSFVSLSTIQLTGAPVRRRCVRLRKRQQIAKLRP